MSQLPLVLNPLQAVGRLGSFWSQVYHGQDDVRAVVRSRLTLAEQTWVTMDAARAGLSREAAPIYREQLWYPLLLRQSQMELVGVVLPEYGGGYNYGDAIVYGQHLGQRFRFGVPNTLVGFGFVADRPGTPDHLWTPGVDVRLVDGTLEFTSNPFVDSGARTTVVEGDTVLQVWVYRACWDYNDLADSYGFITGYQPTSSSPGYKQLVNAAWDTLLGGPTIESLREAAAALTGLPLVEGASETVVQVLQGPAATQVVTDQQVYDLPVGSTPSVDVGDTVYQGDSLCPGLDLYTGTDLARLTIPALALEPQQLAIRLRGSLVFVNQSVPTSVTYDTVPRVTFPVGGFADDVDAFWAYIRSREDATGVTLAQLIRTQPGAGQPMPLQIPATINPLQLLVQTIIPDSLIVLNLQVPAQSDLRALSILRRFVPAWAMLLCVTQVVLPDEYNELTAATTTIQPLDVAVLGSIGAQPVDTRPIPFIL